MPLMTAIPIMPAIKHTLILMAIRLAQRRTFCNTAEIDKVQRAVSASCAGGLRVLPCWRREGLP